MKQAMARRFSADRLRITAQNLCVSVSMLVPNVAEWQAVLLHFNVHFRSNGALGKDKDAIEDLGCRAARSRVNAASNSGFA